jgi:hypothetical protein
MEMASAQSKRHRRRGQVIPCALQPIIIVLDLFEMSLNVTMLNDNRRRDMAIECKRCGGPTMLETVIKLRRGIFSLRETRWQGAYCATCQLSVSVQDHVPMRPSIVIRRRPRQSRSGFLPMWWRVTPAQSGAVRWV